MTDQVFDTVIIGGGLAGVTTLYELTRQGQSVLLLESRDSVAQGASFANGGMLTASMPDPWNGPGVGKHLLSSLFDPKAAMKLHFRMIPNLVFWGLRFLRNSTKARHRRAILANYALASYSVEETRKLAGTVVPTELLKSNGALKVFDTESAFQDQRSIAELLQDQGLEFKELTPDQVVELEPNLESSKTNIHKGLYYPGDMSGDAHEFCRALADAAIERGAKIKTNVNVWRILAENGVVKGVSSSSGSVWAKNVVVAAGDGSPSLTKPLGIHVPIKPAKGYSVTIDVSGWNERPSMPIIDDAMHAAITPLGDKLRVVGTAEFAGKDHSISQPRIDNLFDLFGRIYPHLKQSLDRSTAKPWAGLRPMTADGVPVIGATKTKGLWLNSGHGHLGWTMAVGSSHLLSALMLGRTPPVEAGHYALNRRYVD